MELADAYAGANTHARSLTGMMEARAALQAEVERMEAEIAALTDLVRQSQSNLNELCDIKNAEIDALREDAERWRKFASLDYEMRCQWVTNLSLMPVLREDIDKWIIDVDGSINADANRYRWLREHTLSRAVPMVRVQIMYRGQYQLHDGSELDAEIDSARSKQ